MALAVDGVAFLERLRELYSHPLGMARFAEYLAMVRSRTGEMALPISNVNPMAKPYVQACLERWLALDVENTAFAAAREAAARIDVDDELRVIVLIADDAAGGWTNRAFAEFAHRYERRHEVARGWATVMLWSSEEPTAELAAMRVRETLYRTVDERRARPVRTLDAILEREGRVQRFAGARPIYDDATFSRIGSIIEPHRQSAATPLVFASLYGDEVAASLGYPPLGVPDRGGYDWALARTAVLSR